MRVQQGRALNNKPDWFLLQKFYVQHDNTVDKCCFVYYNNFQDKEKRLKTQQHAATEIAGIHMSLVFASHAVAGPSNNML